MELFLDVDGVILDFEGAFIDYVRDNFLPDLPVDYEPKSWEMSEEFKALKIDEIWKKFVYTDRFKQMNLLIDSESFNALSELYPIYLITNLPQAQFESRKENLEMHNLKYRELTLAGHFNFGIDDYPTKSAMISRLRTAGEKIVFLDDHPANCEDVKASFPESDVYLMSRPHNEKVDDREWIRVKDWQNFAEKVS